MKASLEFLQETTRPLLDVRIVVLHKTALFWRAVFQAFVYWGVHNERVYSWRCNFSVFVCTMISYTRTNNQMSILRVNRSKTKYCVFHSGMITWNSLPDIFKVNVSFSIFKSKVRNFYLEKYFKILILGASMIAFFSDMRTSAVFQVKLFLILSIVL